jgi:hypothetical protein
MRRMKTAALTTVMATILAGGVAAPHTPPYFHPWNDPSFTGRGVLTIKQTVLPGPGTVVCKAMITGSVASGVVTITGVTLLGDGPTCAAITPRGSPTATANLTPAGSADFPSIGYTGPAPVGTCAPALVTFTTTTAGVWNAANAPVGTCFISFNLTTHAHVYAV